MSGSAILKDETVLEPHAVAVSGRTVPARTSEQKKSRHQDVYDLLVQLYEEVRDHPLLPHEVQFKSAQAWSDNGRLTFIIEIDAPKTSLSAFDRHGSLTALAEESGMLKSPTALVYRLTPPPALGRRPTDQRGAGRVLDRLRGRKFFGSLCQQLDLELHQPAED